AGAALARPLPALVPGGGGLPAPHLARAHLLSPVPNRALVADPPLQPDRADLRRDPPQDQGDRPPTGRAVLPVAGMGGAGPGWPRLAGCHPDSGRGAPASGSTPPTPPSTWGGGGGRRGCHPRRIGSAIGSPRPRFSTISGTPPHPGAVVPKGFASE